MVYILSNCIFAQKIESISSSVNRVYKFDAGIQGTSYIKGALEIKYTNQFRIKQNKDFPEISEVYNLDSDWKIPQCQIYSSLDSCHGGNLIFIFELWTNNDTITIEYLDNNKVIESKEYVLEIGEWPSPSSLDLIDDLIVHPIKANHTLKEYQGINHFSLYDTDSVTNKQISKTGILRTNAILVEIDTIDIKNLSGIAISQSKWAARGSAKPEKYGVTSLYYGKTDSIEIKESWKSIPINDMVIRNIFIENDIIYVLTSKGLHCIIEGKLIKDPSFHYHRDSLKSSTFHGLFNYNGYTAIVFNEDILVHRGNKWESIYKFQDKYKYECTAISFNPQSIHFVADRKLWFTDLDTTYQVRSDIIDIMSISEGPNNSILYKQGKLGNNCDHGGIYFTNTGENLELKREYLSKYPDMTINNIFYMKKRNKIIVTSYPGLFEFELVNWMKKDEINR